MIKKVKLVLLFTILISFLSNMALAGSVEHKAANPWMIYLGGFGGYYGADFAYGGNYFASINAITGGNQVFNNSTFQAGVLGGVQVGAQYHFKSPYFVGLSFSDMSNANKARITVFVDNQVTDIPFNINHVFRVQYNLDIAAIIGADVTPQTHVYLKAGASYAAAKDKLFTTEARENPFPIPAVQQTQRKNLWGWLLGFGLTHDLSRWINAFVEYDHYDYGKPNLNSLNGISRTVPANRTNRLTQHVAITANAFRVGLNLKFMDNPVSAAHRFMVTKPWLVYLGVLGGYYGAGFGYGGNYFSTRLGGANLVLNDHTLQQGYSLGGKLGFDYHFKSPYYAGLVFSIMTNANKAHLTEDIIGNLVSPLLTNAGFNINHELRLQDTLDIAGIIGADITPQTHTYLKVGASYASFKHKLFTTLARFAPFPIPAFQQTQRKGLWGWVLGVGLAHDLSRWINAFVEYDHYDYGKLNLNSLDNIAPGIPATEVDRLTQHVAIAANAFLMGVNFKLIHGVFSAPRHIVVTNPWLIYLGVLGGYYGADFGYGANYFTTLSGGSNQVFNDCASQQSYSVGGQLGFNYHFQTPYYAGFVFGIMSSANKARLTNILEDAVSISNATVNINHEFRIRSTLDIAGLIGADITPQTHIYLKVGASYASFKHKLFTTLGAFAPFPIPAFKQTQKKGLWGWVLGVGLTHDLSRWINAFVEYDHYDYGKPNLNSLNNILPLAFPGLPDRLTQHIAITANSFRAGLNLKIEI